MKYNRAQKNIKEMVKEWGVIANKISMNKAENLLDKISNYADIHNESVFLKALIIADLEQVKA